MRRLVERLAKRCGYDAVAAVLPEEHSKLLIHIRKAHSRKERLRAASQAGSEVRVRWVPLHRAAASLLGQCTRQHRLANALLLLGATEPWVEHGMPMRCCSPCVLGRADG